MIRFSAALAILCGLGLVVAQEPAKQEKEEPIRLQKKTKSEPPKAAAEPAKKGEQPPPKAAAKGGDKKAEEKKEPEEPPALDPKAIEEKIQETLGRLSKNFRTAEKKLDEKDASDGTQQVLRDIVKDLDDLIEQMQQQQDQQDQQQQQQQSQSQSQQQQQQQQQRRQARRQQQLQRRQQARNQQRPQQQANGQPMQPDQQQQPQPLQGNPPPNAASKSTDKNRIADLYKDVWGHLPETLRQEMNQYSREQFMGKYNDLLKQYYATIAEKGRKKSEP